MSFCWFPKTANYFYPHPPRGGRQYIDAHLDDEVQFLSTPSARRATRSQRPAGVNQTNFYPRPPRGGRQYIDAHLDDEVQFLSTPSARRATPKAVKASVTMSISIHALREEGDPERWH